MPGVVGVTLGMVGVAVGVTLDVVVVSVGVTLDVVDVPVSAGVDCPHAINRTANINRLASAKGVRNNFFI
ncbi:hypothetical protein KSZ_57590 [Dictyobacter formicarum]|uniref:Secreted protein n=1 Tax=Dictyobacter formicarum TaxID=2778368 RepID=A0ABQ3VQT5_9CHLR|nr:hypothetical protein KSZ_57590 [Dictyobacter formicarum]